MEANWDSLELQNDIELLRKQVWLFVDKIQLHMMNNLALWQAIEDTLTLVGVPEIASSDQTPASIMTSVIANVNWNMDQDRKMTALKQLQGHMWRKGYSSGEIHGQ